MTVPYASVGDDKAVGVVGDERKYGNIVMIRVVESIDAMTADWSRLPHDILAKISNRITSDIEDVTWVSYVVSSPLPLLNHNKNRISDEIEWAHMDLNS